MIYELVTLTLALSRQGRGEVHQSQINRAV